MNLNSMQLKFSKQNIFLFVFIFGIVIGTICGNILSNKQIYEIGILNDFFFDKYTNITINYTDLLKFVLLKRIKVVLFLWLLSITFLGIPYIIGFIGFYGFNFGFILALGTIKFGFKGILLNIVYILPHFLIYVPVILYLIYKGYSICSSLYYKKLAGVSSFRTNIKPLFAEYVLVLFICLLIYIIGCLLETFVNPILVKLFITRFMIP